MTNILKKLCQEHAFHLLNKNEDELKKLYLTLSFKEEGLDFNSFISKEISHDFNFKNIELSQFKITHLNIIDFEDEKIKNLFMKQSTQLKVDFVLFYQLEVNGQIIYNQILPIKKINDSFLISSLKTEYEYQTGHKFKIPLSYLNEVKNLPLEKLNNYLFEKFQYLFVAILLKNERELMLTLPKMNFFGDSFNEKRKEGLAKYNTYNFQQNYELLFQNKFIASSFQQLETKPIKQPLFIKKLNQELTQDKEYDVNSFILKSLPQYDEKERVVKIPKLLGLPFCFHIEFKDGDVWSYDNENSNYQQIIDSGIKVDKEIEQIYVLDCVDNCFILTFNK